MLGTARGRLGQELSDVPAVAEGVGHLPVPLAPPVTAIHNALLTAVHVQPFPAVTVTVAVCAAAVSVCVGGEIE